MKLFVMLAILAFSSSLFAAFPIIEIDDLDGSFVNGQGNASAESAFYALKQVEISHKKIEVDISKPDKNLVIKDPYTSVKLTFDFSFMDIFKSFTLNSLYLKSSDKVFDLDVGASSVYIQDQEYKFTQGEVYSEAEVKLGDPKRNIEILIGITEDCLIKFKDLKFSSPSSMLNFEELIQDNPDLELQLRQAFKVSIPVYGARNFKLEIKKQKFHGTVVLDSYLDPIFAFAGDVFVTDKKDKLYIKLNKAKLGWFSIKKTILGRVRALQLENIVVVDDTIIVTLE